MGHGFEGKAGGGRGVEPMGVGLVLLVELRVVLSEVGLGAALFDCLWL